MPQENTIDRVPEVFRPLTGTSDYTRLSNGTRAKIKNLHKQLTSKKIEVLKARALLVDSLERSRGMERISFKGYSLVETGVLSAHPSMDYYAETSGYSADTPLYGIELETDRAFKQNNSTYFKTAALLSEHLRDQHFVCRDGSINNDHGEGIEIVTAPRSELDIRSNYTHYYKLLKGMVEQGWRSHESGNCGLHIHVSRKNFTPEEITAMEHFIVRSKKLWKTLSRRTKEEYCHFSEDRDRHGRYKAVNPTTNTIEFRLMRGTLKPETFFASLELIFELPRFIRSGEQRTPKKFLYFLKRSTSKYAAAYVSQVYTKLYPPRSHISNISPATGRPYNKTERREIRLKRQAVALKRLTERVHTMFNIAMRRGHRYIANSWSPIQEYREIRYPIVWEGFSKKFTALATRLYPHLVFRLLKGSAFNGVRICRYGNKAKIQF